MTDNNNKTRWEKIQLTQGSDSGRFHSHAYYDIPVFDSTSRLLAGHCVSFQEKSPTPEDKIDIGYMDLEGDREWKTVGQSSAWSWQQGAMSQWLPQTDTLIWNDRQDGRFVSKHYSVGTGDTKTFPHPVYAVAPDGKFFLSLNMARLDYVRPGYGYAGGQEHKMESLKPKDDGVWRIDANTGEETLLLSLNDAAQFLLSRLPLRLRFSNIVRRYVFWFNHVKISPDGKRFTVKLRFRSRDLTRKWNDSMGCSLTCGTDGKDLRLLEHATSHVIWLDNTRLYFWKENGVYLYEDAPGGGKRLQQMAPALIDHNVHIRHFPDNPEQFIFDTPYRETIDLFTYHEPTGEREKIATFYNHKPRNGEYRCDLHPCPSPDGEKIVVTSLDDGGRQMYLFQKTD